MKLRSSLFVALLAVTLGAAGVRGAETVWSGLVIADNAPQPVAIPSELNPIEQNLKELFGYNQFQIIGHSSKTLESGKEGWIAWSRYFSLQVDAKGRGKGGYLLNLRLWKEKELLLESEAKLSRHSPLVIKGPQVGPGQLLLVLIVQ